VQEAPGLKPGASGGNQPDGHCELLYTDPSLVQLGFRCNSHDPKEQAGSQSPCVGVTKSPLRRFRRTTFFGGTSLWLRRELFASKSPRLISTQTLTSPLSVLETRVVGWSSCQSVTSSGNSRLPGETATTFMDPTVRKPTFALASVRSVLMRTLSFEQLPITRY
jgi:hypothetical protein